jgi:hypothetical protein
LSPYRGDAQTQRFELASSQPPLLAVPEAQAENDYHDKEREPRMSATVVSVMVQSPSLVANGSTTDENRIEERDR